MEITKLPPDPINIHLLSSFCISFRGLSGDSRVRMSISDDHEKRSRRCASQTMKQPLASCRARVDVQPKVGPRGEGQGWC